MADEANVDEVIVDTTADDTNVPDTTDYKALYEAEQATIEKLKLDNAGSERARTKAIKEKEDLLKANETAQQTAEREAADKQAQILEDRKKNEEALQKQTLELQEIKIEKESYKYNLDPEVIKMLGFKTVEQVAAYAKQIELVSEAVREETNKKIEKVYSGLDQKDYKSKIKTETLSPLEKKIINAR